MTAGPKMDENTAEVDDTTKQLILGWFVLSIVAFYNSYMKSSNFKTY